MVEAKVDIRRLQLLNDRIAQVMDALNQVRLSVHGLTHTGAPIGQPQLGFQQQLPYAIGQPIGFQHTPYSGVPTSMPFGQFGWPVGLQTPTVGGFGAAFGLQHTAYSPYVPYTPYSPLTQGIQGIAQVPGWSGSSAWFPYGGGLYHSPDLMEQRLIEQKVNDPNRILHTFPFCLAPLSSASIW